MADASRVLVETEPAAPAAPAAADAPAPAPAVEDLDDLVEDVSIDGMCGVY
jgi:mycofactocin precursor